MNQLNPTQLFAEAIGETTSWAELNGVVRVLEKFAKATKMPPVISNALGTLIEAQHHVILKTQSTCQSVLN